MGPFLVAAMLAASEGGAVEVSRAAREAPRLHGAAGLAGTIGFGGFVRGGGPGVTAEFGLTLRDRTTLSLRASLGTLLFTAAASLGVAVDYAVSDRWSVGTGAMLGYLGGFMITDMPMAFVLQVPVRAQVALWTRSSELITRQGLKLYFEAGPGVVLSGTRGYVPETYGVPLERWAVMGALGMLWEF